LYDLSAKRQEQNKDFSEMIITPTDNTNCDGRLGAPIPRKEAIRLARKIMEDAEEERRKCAEKEAARNDWGDEPAPAMFTKAIDEFVRNAPSRQPPIDIASVCRMTPHSIAIQVFKYCLKEPRLSEVMATHKTMRTVDGYDD